MSSPTTPGGAAGNDTSQARPEGMTGAILTRLPISIYGLNLQGVIAATNPAGARLLGLDAAEMAIGRPFITLLAEDDRERVAPPWAQAMTGEDTSFDAKSSSGEPISVRLLPVVQGTTVRIVLAVAEPRGEWVAQAKRLRDSEARVRDSEARLSDIEARLRDSEARVGDSEARARDSEARVRRTEARQRLFLSGSPDIIFAQDRDLRYTFVVNAPAGLDADEMVGRLDTDLFDAKVAGTLHLLKQSVLKDGKARELDVTLGSGKREQHFHMTFGADRDPAGQIQGIVGHGRDVGTIRKARDEVEQLRRQLQTKRKVESAGEMAGAIAKDFAKLLVSIRGNASLAQLELTPDHPAMPSIDKALEAVQQAADLARQLIGYTSQAAATAGPVQLSECIRDMEPLLRSSVASRATLRLDLGEDLPRLDLGVTQAQQVVTALVVRAANGFEDEPGTVTIRTRAVQPPPAAARMSIAPGSSLAARAHVVLEVIDDGPGIDSASQRQIFDPDGPNAELATMRGIVRSHRGAVQVATSPGEGTTFRVLLPVDPPSTRPPPPSRSEASKAPGSGESQPK